MKMPTPEDFGLTQQDIDFEINREKVAKDSAGKNGLIWGSGITLLVMLIFIFNICNGRLCGGGIVAAFFLGLMIWLPVGGISYWLSFKIHLFFNKSNSKPNGLEKAKNYIEAKKKYEWNLLREQKEFWQSLRGDAFEIELATLLKKHGHKVHLTSSTGDRGVDIFLDDNTIIQCKAHEKPVGVGAARDLYGALHDLGAHEAILASVSGFTKGVYDFTKEKPIILMDLQDIIDLSSYGATTKFKRKNHPN